MKARLQFSLPVLLMAVTIACIALAVWFQPRSISTIARDMYRTDFHGRKNDQVNFESDTQSLRPLLAKLPAPVPSDLQEYLDHCIPNLPVFIDGAGIDVHTWENCRPKTRISSLASMCFHTDSSLSQAMELGTSLRFAFTIQEFITLLLVPGVVTLRYNQSEVKH